MRLELNSLLARHKSVPLLWAASPLPSRFHTFNLSWLEVAKPTEVEMLVCDKVQEEP